MKKTIAAVALTAVAVGGGTATAAKFITSADIKDGTIRTADISNDAVSLNRLSPGVRAMLAQAGKAGKDGTNGTNGAGGAVGANGNDGAKGDTGGKGETGAQGAKGDTGATGPQGSQGNIGPIGPVGPQGPQGPQGSSAAMPADFALTNSSVKLTSDGVEFGPYANAGTAGGSIQYTGVSGKTLGDITKLTYRTKYTTSDADDHATPYLRVWIDNDANGTVDHSVIFSPNTQAQKDTAEGAFHTYDAMAGSVRYDDDAGDGSGQYGLNGTDWDTLVADHGGDKIMAVYVTTGFSGGHDAKAFVTDMSVNSGTWHFGQNGNNQ